MKCKRVQKKYPHTGEPKSPAKDLDPLAMYFVSLNEDLEPMAMSSTGTAYISKTFISNMSFKKKIYIYNAKYL